MKSAVTFVSTKSRRSLPATPTLLPAYSSIFVADVSSQRRKSRKAYFTAPSSIRRKMMSAQLSKELAKKYLTRSIPVRNGDTVKVVRGPNKNREGKVTEVYRRRWCIHIEKLIKEKTNGQQANIPIHPSNVQVTSLRLDKDRKALLENKKRKSDDKGKVDEMD